MKSGRRRTVQPREAVSAITASRPSEAGCQSAIREATSSSAVHLADVLADLPQLVWITDLNGRCIYVNGPFEEFVGASLDKLLNLSWVDYLHPKDVVKTMQSWQSSVRDSKTHQTHYRIRRYDNSYRSMLARAVLAVNPDGSASHWIGTNTDVHDVYEAMQDVQNNFSSQQDFVRNMARDLLTPLGVINVAADLALEHPDDERRVAKYLETIHKNVDRLDTMVADLLNINPAQGQAE